MLVRPEISDERIAEHVRQVYGLAVRHAAFLPVGADFNSAAFRLFTNDSSAYFLKLRKGNFKEISIDVPRFLHRQGIRQIIAPVETQAGDAWSWLEGYACVIYPYIEGKNGFELALTDGQWVEFGAALRGIHEAELPPALKAQIPEETYTARWRDAVRGFQTMVETTTFTEPVAAKMVEVMRVHQEDISFTVMRAETLAAEVAAQSHKQVLCHADIHAGNLLIVPDGSFFIVDWDDPILAPRERDLMFTGAGIGGVWKGKRSEALFFGGYGEVEIDRKTLAYYRYERIVQDYAAYCEQILLSDEGGEDREQSLYYFSSNFWRDGVLDIARKTDE
jgi:spectinomycin phosphotransferase